MMELNFLKEYSYDEFIKLLFELTLARTFTFSKGTIQNDSAETESSIDTYFFLRCMDTELKPVEISETETINTYKNIISKELLHNATNKLETARDLLKILNTISKSYITKDNYLIQQGIEIAYESEDKLPLTTERRNKLNNYFSRELEMIEILKTFTQEFVDNHISSNSSSISIEKIKSNLSVKDLALLFKLLAAEKVIEVPNISSLSRTISQSFYTEKSPEISPKSFKNQYDDPKQPSIDKIDPLLVNMRQSLKKF